MSKPPLIAVVGFKRSGKTRLVSLLVELLTGRGLRVGTLKHDGHDFPLDTPGTDSWRHLQAGARASAVFSKRRWALFREGEPDLGGLLRSMEDMDLVLAEGMKNSSLPKIVLLKAGEFPPASAPVLALVSDALPLGLPPFASAAPLFQPDDLPGLAEVILAEARRRS